MLKEGEANELARSRAATVEGKTTVNKLTAAAAAADNDEPITEEEEKAMIAKLRKAGKYSIKTNKKGNTCERCTNPRAPHTPVSL